MILLSNTNINQACLNKKDLKAYKLCEMLRLTPFKPPLLRSTLALDCEALRSRSKSALGKTQSGLRKLYFITCEFQKKIWHPSGRCLILPNVGHAYRRKTIRVDRRFFGHVNHLLGHKLNILSHKVQGGGVMITQYDLVLKDSRMPNTKSQLSTVLGHIMVQDNLWQVHPGVKLDINKAVFGAMVQTPSALVLIKADELKQACFQTSFNVYPGVKTLNFKNTLAKKAHASRNILKHTVLMHTQNRKKNPESLQIGPV